MNKDRLVKIMGIVLTAVIALLAVFGYDVAVIQPRETLAGQVVACNGVGLDAAVSGAAEQGR